MTWRGWHEVSVRSPADDLLPVAGDETVNRKIHAGFVGLAALGIMLVVTGWLGLRGDPALRAPVMHCGDPTCTEAHP